MKSKYLLFLLLFFNYSIAQEIIGTVLDSITKEPIELATVTFASTKYSVFSGKDGKFRAKLNDLKDSIQISNIGYQTKKISLSDFKEKKLYSLFYYLIPQKEQLEEVVISTKKIDYGSNNFIKSAREKTQYIGFQFGTEHCKLIENSTGKKGKLTALYLDLQKHEEDDKIWKLDYLATFCIRFYKYDEVYKKPGAEIYNKNIIVEPKNKSYKLKIDLDSLKIKFPPEGICIGVEIINTKYINPKKTFATIAPLINFSEIKNSEIITSWIRYRNEDWKFKPFTTRDRNGQNSQRTGMVIDVAVKYEKE